MKKILQNTGTAPFALVAALCLALSMAILAAPVVQKTFPTPDDAWKALVDSVSKQDTAAVKAIFGPDSEDLITSGDPVADKNVMEAFLSIVKEKVQLVKEGEDKVVVVLGKEEWPFAVPIVKKGGAWSFDTAVGKEEIVNRRIGKNELYTIAVCRTYVDAQEEYASLHKEHQYAQRFLSSEGTHDGLYWKAKEGEPQSPFGPFAAQAVKEGYGKSTSGEPQPFHGYYFKILKAQGKNAPEGEKSYVQGDKMTGGFALVAFPATYGVSGVMTFLVDKQGVVFQKDLGPKSAEIASSMTAYDPDETWEPVKD